MGIFKKDDFSLEGRFWFVVLVVLNVTLGGLGVRIYHCQHKVSQNFTLLSNRPDLASNLSRCELLVDTSSCFVFGGA